MATQTDIDAAKAAGYMTPTGAELISEGDNAITENAVVAYLQRFYRGGLAGTDPGALGLGIAHVSSGTGATALGLPEAIPGHVLNLPFGSLGTRIFITSSTPPRLYGQQKTSTGWKTWDGIGDKFYLGGAATTATAPMNSMDTLPTGAFSLSTVQAAQQLNVPINTSGVGLTVRFGSLDYAFQIVFALETPSTILTRFKFSGAWSAWSDPIGSRIPQGTSGDSYAGSGMKRIPLALTLGQGDMEAPLTRQYRVPFQFNAPVTRWRLHMTDRNPHTGGHLGANIMVNNVYVGSHAGNGSFTATPTRIGGGIALDSLPNGEWVSAWRNETIGNSVERLLSYDYTSTVAPFYAVAGAYNTGNLDSGAVQFLDGTSTPFKNATFDMWIEAETYSTTPVIAVFGDSLSSGAQATLPCHESVASIYARSKNALPVHFAVSGNAMQDWAEDTESYKWTRWQHLDRADTVLWAMGHNDVYRGRTEPEMRADFNMIYPFVTARMGRTVVAATATTRNSPADPAWHNTRKAWNAWLKAQIGAQSDGRVRDVFDFDAVVNAGDDTIKPEFNTDGIHLNTAGYMAEVGTITRPILSPAINYA